MKEQHKGQSPYGVKQKRFNMLMVLLQMGSVYYPDHLLYDYTTSN